MKVYKELKFYPPLFMVFILLMLQTTGCSENGVNIDRKKVVQRHNVFNDSADTLASLTVGNGTFAYTVDITGMQSFPEYYAKGVSLGTQSEWGWDSFDNNENYKFEETLKAYDFNNEGREALYSIQYKTEGRAKGATNYFRENAHRLQLGNVGLELYSKDGERIDVDYISQINQTLDLWRGIVQSEFSVDGDVVKVETAASQSADQIAVKIRSHLIEEGRLKVFLKYPYPTGKFLDEATNYDHEESHSSRIIDANERDAKIIHTLNGCEYFTTLHYSSGKLEENSAHYFVYQPSSGRNEFEFSFAFGKEENDSPKYSDFSSIKKECENTWEQFWQSGAAVDFEGSTDPRAEELERRIVLSQYLTKVQCGGENPPQETGLTFNSWYGKPHTEMHWWHGVHFALWGRPEIMEKNSRLLF